MRGTTYSSKVYFHRERQLNAEAPASPAMPTPLPPRPSAMRKREERHDGVEIWEPEAA